MLEGSHSSKESNYFFFNVFISIIIIIIISSSSSSGSILALLICLHQLKQMVFHWSLCDSKSPQISKTLLNIPADFSSTVLWMVLIILPLNNSLTSILPRLLEIVPRVKNRTGITVTFMFHSFFSPLARSKVLLAFLLPSVPASTPVDSFFYW